MILNNLLYIKILEHIQHMCYLIAMRDIVNNIKKESVAEKKESVAKKKASHETDRRVKFYIKYRYHRVYLKKKNLKEKNLKKNTGRLDRLNTLGRVATYGRIYETDRVKLYANYYRVFLVVLFGPILYGLFESFLLLFSGPIVRYFMALLVSFLFFCICSMYICIQCILRILRGDY